jgi:hypothetical protein
MVFNVGSYNVSFPHQPGLTALHLKQRNLGGISLGHFSHTLILSHREAGDERKFILISKQKTENKAGREDIGLCNFAEKETG